MKKMLLHPALFILGAGIFVSCKKETSCEGCKENNKPPISIAGADEVITLPTDSILLDGSASNDPDGMIISYLWKKISGLASFNMPLLDMQIMGYPTMQEPGVLVEL